MVGATWGVTCLTKHSAANSLGFDQGCAIILKSNKILILKLQYPQSIEIEEVLILGKWKTTYRYWNWDCKIFFGSIDIELKLQNHFWKYWYWYWYCTKERSKLLQYFAKPYVVNIAIILRLNHQYCKNIGLEKILKLQKFVSDIEIEIEIAKIFFRYWNWNWYRIFFLQVLILKLILYIFSSAIEMLTILKISVLRSPGLKCKCDLQPLPLTRFGIFLVESIYSQPAYHTYLLAYL